MPCDMRWDEGEMGDRGVHVRLLSMLCIVRSAGHVDVWPESGHEPCFTLSRHRDMLMCGMARRCNNIVTHIQVELVYVLQLRCESCNTYGMLNIRNMWPTETWLHVQP